jgi:hypothetical protein
MSDLRTNAAPRPIASPTLTRSSSVSTPTASPVAPPARPRAESFAGVGQRSEALNLQAELSSPAVADKVGALAASKGEAALQSNAAAQHDLGQALIPDLPAPASTIPTPPSLPTAAPKPTPTLAPVTRLRANAVSLTSPPAIKSMNPLMRTDHVINTHIMQAALDSPAVADLKGKIYSLDRDLQRLDGQLKSLSDFVNEVQAQADSGQAIPATVLEAVKEAKQDIARVTKQLGQLKTQRQGLSQSLAQTLAAQPADAHPKTLWEQVKGRYIENEDSASSFNMKAAIDYRQQLMDTLVKEEATRLNLPVAGAADQAHTVTKVVGSSAMTSDRDINITVKNGAQGQDAQLVAAVNTRFRSMFGQDSGSYFDTNLYNEGLMPDIERIKNGQPVDVWANPAAGALNAEKQDLVAMVKQRRFFASADEWSEHVVATVGRMQAGGASEDKIQAFLSQTGQANDLVEQADAQINARMNTLIAKYPEASHPELELMASNELYLEHVHAADQLITAAGGDEMKLAEARFTMGLAHYFANEAGMSEGVLRDVVINGQEIPNGINPQRRKEGKPDIAPMNLSAGQLLQSFNENLGECLKEFNHYSADVGQAAVHGSKYIGRLARGLEQLAGKAGLNRQALGSEFALATQLLKAERGIDLPGGGKAGLLDLRKNEKIDELAQRFGITVNRADLEGTKALIGQAILQESGLGGLTDVAALRTAIKTLGQAVNAATRSS